MPKKACWGALLSLALGGLAALLLAQARPRIAIVSLLAGLVLPIFLLIDTWREKTTEEKLLRAEAKFRELFDSAADAILIHDLEGRILEVNRTACERFEYSREELLHLGLQQIVGSRQTGSFAERIDALKRTPYLIFESEHVSRSGRVIPVEVHSNLIDYEGRSAVLAVGRDISERCKAEETLRERERMLSLIVNAVPQTIFWKDRASVYLGGNENFARAAGLEQLCDISGKTDYELPWLPEEAEAFRRDDQEVFQSGRAKRRIIESVRLTDGSRIWTETSKIPLVSEDGSVFGVLGVYDDITERKRTEEALRQSEERLRIIFETSPAGIYQVESDGRFVFGNRRLAEMLGYSLPELLETRYQDHVDPSERDAATARMFAHLRGEFEHALVERRFVRKDGTAFWGYLSSKVMEGAEGMPPSIVGIVGDITEWKEAKEALRTEKERLAVTLRSIGDGVITTDVEGRVVLLNRVAEELCGVSQEEARGKPLRKVFRILHEKTGEPLENPADSAMRSGKTIGLTNHALLCCADGTERPIADSAAPILDSEGQTLGVVLVFRDMTEKKAFEEELLRARKLDSLGILAGGIAHDFNNLLTGIMGNISMARAQLSAGTPLATFLERAEKAADRATELTRQLLTFSKGGRPVKKLASLRGMLVDATEFSLSGSNVRPEFDISEDLWPVEADIGQMGQVIHNLVLNAAQAMPGGGTVKVRAENEPSSEEGSAGWIRIDVEDAGVGIAPEDLDRIFDPYYTTKPSGTGLGLATVYSIVRNHDGEIRVVSKLREGTAFTIRLPASGRSALFAIPAAELAVRGRGRILVMDDEEMIRDLLRSILESLGYEPTTCGDGAEALKLYGTQMRAGRPFDAVIMDLTIPGGMGGKEAVKCLLELDSAARVIVSSGYSNDPVLASFRGYGFCGAVAKPFKVRELGAALAQALAPG
ncbi:MAG: PAS domain S-box protein [Deltaproteobacteria bacterium]|nr:PAS domain S-box protein [Deltaproteobacteria bacterium]